MAEKNLNERTKEEDKIVDNQIKSFDEAIAKEKDPNMIESLKAEKQRLVEYRNNSSQRKTDRARNNISNNAEKNALSAESKIFGTLNTDALANQQYKMSDEETQALADNLDAKNNKTAASVTTDKQKKAIHESESKRKENADIVGSKVDLKNLSEEEIKERMKNLSPESDLYLAYASELQVREDLAKAEDDEKKMMESVNPDNIGKGKSTENTTTTTTTNNDNGKGKEDGEGGEINTGNEDLNKVLKQLEKYKDPYGNSYITIDKDGNFIQQKPMTNGEFRKALKEKGVSSIWDNISKIATLASTALTLVGLEPINFSGIHKAFGGNDINKMYDEYMHFFDTTQQGISQSIATAIGGNIESSGSRTSDAAAASDEAWLNAKTKLADAQGDWNKLEQADLLAFNNKLAMEMAKYNNDLAKDYQSFFSGLQLNQQKELLQIMAQGEVNKIQTFMNQVDPQAWGKFSHQMESSSHYSGGFKGIMEGAKDIMGVGAPLITAGAGGSDKKIKSFIVPKHGLFH